MAVAIAGLNKKPTYNELIGEALQDQFYNVKFPNRNAKFLREGFILSQLDGEGMREMQRQQEMASKEAYKEHLLKQIAINSGAKLSDLKNGANAETQTDKVERMLRNTGTNTIPPPTSSSSATMTEQQQTSSSATMTEHQPTSSSAMNTEQKETTTRGTSTEQKETTTIGTSTKQKETATIGTGTQYYDISDEESAIAANYEQKIEELRVMTELQRQQQEIRHQEQVETIRQQARTQLQKQADRHEIEKQRLTHELTQTHQQQANTVLGQIQQQSNELNRIAGERVRQEEQAKNAAVQQANQLLHEQFERERAEEQQRLHQQKERKRAETKQLRNQDNPPSPSSPDGGKKKTKAGPSPNKIPPTGEEEASGSRDKPKYDPEKSHEPKGPRGRPKSTTESTIKTEQQVTKPKPRHGTEIDMNTDETYWQKQNLTYIKDQLDMRNWRGPKIKKDGTRMLKADYLAELMKLIKI